MRSDIDEFVTLDMGCVGLDLDGTLIDTEEFTIASKQIEGKIAKY